MLVFTAYSIGIISFPFVDYILDLLFERMITLM